MWLTWLIANWEIHVVLGIAWFLIVIIWTRHQRINNLRFSVIDIEKALKGQEKSLKELVKTSEEFCDFVEDAVRKFEEDSESESQFERNPSPKSEPSIKRNPIEKKRAID